MDPQSDPCDPHGFTANDLFSPAQLVVSALSSAVHGSMERSPETDVSLVVLHVAWLRVTGLTTCPWGDRIRAEGVPVLK